MNQLPAALRRFAASLLSLLRRRGRFTVFLFALATMFLTGLHIHVLQSFFAEETSRAGSVPTGVPEPALPEPVEKVDPPPTWQGTIRKGTGLAETLADAGLTPALIAEVADGLAPVVDLRRLRAGTKVTVTFGPEGEPLRIACQTGLLEEVVLERTAKGWEARRERLAAETRVETVSGTIDTSLFESLADLGEGDRLTVDFVDIFAWDIDFSHELQKGDTFRIVVEKIYREGAFLTYGRILAAEYRDREELHQAFFFPSSDGRGDYFTPEGKSLRKTFLRAPVSYSRISSGYSRRRLHPILRKAQPHLGVDYAAPPGTPVWAPAEGTVVSTSRDRTNGRKIVLRHPNGYTTYYLHLARFARGIRKGRKVRQKQVIGYVGSSGRSTGPHLDYRMKKGGRWVNPLQHKFPPGKPLPQEHLAEFSRYREWLTGRLSSPPGAFLADADASRQ
jgi:murein DD-endopeptidase MepM/ murein hydrolase activator NlpD